MKNLTATVLKQGSLSKREAVVLKYLCEGYMRKEIAKKEFKSESCISKQIESIAYKLDCHSAAEIVATATALKIVNIKVNSQLGLFAQFITVLLMVNTLAGQMDIRGPRSPRPIRTRTTSSQVKTARQT